MRYRMDRHYATLSATYMPFHISPNVTPLLSRATTALGMTQKQVGEAFGISLRTAQRWHLGGSYPNVEQVKRLAGMVFPYDPDLAEELAVEAGTTLEALGLVAPPAPSPPPPLPAVVTGPPPRTFPPVALMVDSIFLAAIDAAQSHGPSTTPRESVPAIVKAAFARARGLGLSMAEVDDALSARSAAG
jgi:hypothetical protein